MPCTDNIVTLGACPDNGTPVSGLTLLQAPGISPKGLSQVATDTYISGTALAMEKKALAITQVRSDFLGVLQNNNVLTYGIAIPTYDSSQFIPTVSQGTTPAFRGVELYRNTAHKGALRRNLVTAVQCYPLASGFTTLRIEDGQFARTWPVQVVANQINTFNSTNLTNFPYVMPAGRNMNIAKVTFDQSTIPFASAEVICHKGCNGNLPNDCAWAEGWDGTKTTRDRQSFGVNVQFSCECDYDRVLCDMARSHVGMMIWLKWQICLFEEQHMSNRFSNWVTFNGDKIQTEVLPRLNAQYNQKLNEMAAGLPEILKKYRDDCFECRKTRFVVNF